MSKPLPPRPRPPEETAPPQPASEPPPLHIPIDAEPRLSGLDEDVRRMLEETISKAVAAQLGKVQVTTTDQGAKRISSIPPSGPRSSMRAAAHVGTKAGKWITIGSGALSLLGTVIAVFVRPEYATPLLQSIRILIALAAAWAGGSVPALAEPAKEPAALVAPMGAAGAQP